MSTLLIFAFVCIISLGCTEHNSSSDYGEQTSSAEADTLLKWKEYFQSSSDGLWEDSCQYNLVITRIHEFGGEEDLNPIFYKPGFVHMMGDTLLITDEATQSLVCMDTTGTLLWKFGEAGEGPGLL